MNWFIISWGSFFCFFLCLLRPPAVIPLSFSGFGSLGSGEPCLLTLCEALVYFKSCWDGLTGSDMFFWRFSVISCSFSSGIYFDFLSFWPAASNFRSFFYFLVNFVGDWSPATATVSACDRFASSANAGLFPCPFVFPWLPTFWLLRSLFSSGSSRPFGELLSSTASLFSYSFLFLFLPLFDVFVILNSSSATDSVGVLDSVSILSSMSETYSLLIFFMSVSNPCSDFTYFYFVNIFLLLLWFCERVLVYSVEADSCTPSPGCCC